MSRSADLGRKTGETDVRLSLLLDDAAPREISTGVGFFDHMLELLARHGRIGLAVTVVGRSRHGRAPHGRGHGDRVRPGARPGARRPPRDPPLRPRGRADGRGPRGVRARPLRAAVLRALRPHRSRPASPAASSTSSREEFLRAVATGARSSRVHVDVEAGTNAHHMIEACFKAFARALRVAVSIDPGEAGVPSTKGTLDVIAMVDYGMGNRRSVEKALEHVGARVARTADHARDPRRRRHRRPRRRRVPGGDAPAARATGSTRSIREQAAAGVPVIGLCLGMQLLFTRSDEHEGAEGLDLIPGAVAKLEAPGLTIPHIGWHTITFARPSPLTEGLGEAATFYHVHSFVPRARGRRRRRRPRRLRRAVRLDRAARQRDGRAVPSGEVLARRARAAAQLRRTSGPRSHDPLPGDRHPRREGRAAHARALRRGDRVPRRPARGGAVVGRRGRALPPRRRPRRRRAGRAGVARPPAADRRRHRRAGAVRRRAADARRGARRAARGRRARDRRHRGAARRRLPGRDRRRPRAADRRLGRRARRADHDGGLDGDLRAARRRRVRPPQRARRVLVRLHRRRPRRRAGRARRSTTCARSPPPSAATSSTRAGSATCRTCARCASCARSTSRA